MIKEWLTDQGLMLGPGVALGLFLVFFIGVLFWIYRPGSNRIYEREAQLPFEDGVRHGALSASPAQED
ncbi:MAG TPA: cbb3-type cytochrome c oxidase subunit 3 [bacterium]|nr:cbb3-type cytochrome c oxidase subunit 3 [bacterium]